MATLRFENINKIYPNNVQAVFDFNLNIDDKEFIIFVGPSGCGKSTTLRMVAGLEDITYGDLYIDDVLVNNVEPKDRGIAMVFQNYALYPTMTVFKNMAFSLKIRKFPTKIKVVDKVKVKELKAKVVEAKNANNLDEIKALEEQISELEKNPSLEKVVMKHMKKEEIKSRVEEAAKILGLTEYLNRKPSALSGGQCQRVALGRAIVRHPKVFLMDEPLSNLDAKLRVQMRTELTRIHNEVGATTIYVTHDQTEAMTMADRIVVMKSGYIQQIATPKEVYLHPNNLFVATFIGSPSMNILEGEYDGKSIKVGDEFKVNVLAAFKKERDEFYKKLIEAEEKTSAELKAEIEELKTNARRNAKAIEQREKALAKSEESLAFAAKAVSGESHKLYVGIRPEDIYLSGDNNNLNPSKPMKVAVDDVELLGQELIVYSKLGDKNILFKVPSANDLKVGDTVEISFNLSTLHAFDYASTLRLPLTSEHLK